MSFVIQDLNTSEFYRQRPGDGWYCQDVTLARIYATKKQAMQTIAESRHNVSYPGNRKLSVRKVTIVVE